MKELNVSELEQINGGDLWATPAEQANIANECKRWGIADPLAFNGNGSLNIGATDDNSIMGCLANGFPSAI